MKAAAPVSCRAATPDDRAVIAELFGPNGASGGCWCMHWRMPKGGAMWKACKGEPNRHAFFKLLKDGHAQGALAFAGDRPVGWCNIGPLEEFPRIRNSRVLSRAAPPGTWSVNCFFVAAGWRRRGVATALLEEASKLAFARGARALEAYPTPQKPDQSLVAAFTWTGTRSLFARASCKPSAENARVWVKAPPR
jgi:GNAT superfamily N-acetyltransferase